MTRALVLGRRRPGRDISGAIAETSAELEAAGWTIESRLVRRKKALRRRAAGAAKAGVDVVVAVGGDGAVLQVVQSIAETPVALGIVPMGTGNLLATNLGIPERRAAAVEVLLRGIQRRIDVGRATVDGRTRCFSVACGVGFDAHVMRATSRRRKVRLGRLAYLVSALGQRRQVRDAGYELTLDGRSGRLEAMQLLVANCGRLGGAFKPKLPIRPDDGVLDVIAIRGRGPLDALLAGWEALRQRRRGRSRGRRAFRGTARSVSIRSTNPRLVEIDGTVVGSTPVEIEVRPGALIVLVPGDAEVE
ncbi:MAG TPA: YegS/Rv2252/BmrU family lipid kinase [Candidatus Limnocylindrales bacterium]